MAEGLAGNSTLEVLNLRFNGIGDEGARAIAKALEGNTALEILNLSNNNIGDGLKTEWKEGEHSLRVEDAILD